MNYTVEIVLADPPRRELSPNHRSDLRHFLSWTVGPVSPSTRRASSPELRQSATE
jgi:hypothetical protein